jgi:hypothetical protein
MTKVRLGKFDYSEEELQKQFKEASQRAAKADLREPRAAHAYYDKRTKRIVVEMTTGVIVSFPPQLLQGLAGASSADLSEVSVSLRGTSLHWEQLDADFSVAGLIAGVFGTRAWMADVGRKGGSVSSSAKAAAARANGQKGGRPRKIAVRPALSTRKQKRPLQENDKTTIPASNS